MAIRKIITPPNPLLKQPSLKVQEVDDNIRALIRDMFDTMYAAPGIGLAAVQVGEPLSIIVMDIHSGDKDKEPRPYAMINPEVVWASDNKVTYQEGCLSVPDVYDEVERPAEVKVRWLDEQGNEREQLFTGLEAVCVQHEIDHTKGILFVDYLSRLKRERYLKKVIKRAQQEMTS